MRSYEGVIIPKDLKVNKKKGIREKEKQKKIDWWNILLIVLLLLVLVLSFLKNK
jgi:hypothetical protein